MFSTDHQGALAAVPGEGVGHGRGGDGLDVGRLPVVPPLLPPGPEGGHGAVPHLGPELVSTLADGQLRPGGHGGGQGQVSLKTEKLSTFVENIYGVVRKLTITNCDAMIAFLPPPHK